MGEIGNKIDLERRGLSWDVRWRRKGSMGWYEVWKGINEGGGLGWRWSRALLRFEASGALR